MNSATLRNIAIVLAAVAGAWFVVSEVRKTVQPARDTAEELAETASELKDIVDLKEVREADPVELLDLVVRTTTDTIQAAEDAVDRAAGMTDEEERAWGEQVHEDIVSSLSVSPERSLQEQINVLAAKLLSERSRTNLEYTVTVLDDREFVAFSILGGFIYVSTGFLDAYEYDDDAVLFVLGHEIGHIELGHCRKKQFPFVVGLSLGGQELADTLSMLHNLLASGYDQDQEYACDLWAYEKMRGIGIPKERRLKGPRALLAFEESVRGSRERPPIEDGDRKTEVLSEILKDYLNSHPDSKDRVARLEALP